jgi:hypothetical protein
MKTLCLFLIAAWTAAPQDDRTAPVLEKYRKFRPADSELGIYRLSWVATLKEARERAAKEERPIFLLVCTNSYGNLFTGHC